MLNLLSAGLLGLVFVSTSASASLLWKNQERFDRLKNERQATLKTEIRRTMVNEVPESKKQEILEERAAIKAKPVAVSPYSGQESSKDIMQEVQRVQRARKIIGALKSMSPGQFKQVFQMDKPEFGKDNPDI